VNKVRQARSGQVKPWSVQSQVKVMFGKRLSQVRCVLVSSKSDQGHVRSGEGQVKVRSRSGNDQVRLRSNHGQIRTDQLKSGRDSPGQVRSRSSQVGSAQAG